MPLKKGCSVDVAKYNYSELLSSGYSKSQAYAIALSEARKYKNMCGKKRRFALGRGDLFDFLD